MRAANHAAFAVALLATGCASTNEVALAGGPNWTRTTPKSPDAFQECMTLTGDWGYFNLNSSPLDEGRMLWMTQGAFIRVDQSGSGATTAYYGFNRYLERVALDCL